MNYFIEIVDEHGDLCFKVLNNTSRDIAMVEKEALNRGYFIKGVSFSIENDTIHPYIHLDKVY